MNYTKEDLEYIFVRIKNSKGKWCNLSIAEVSNKQFVEWIKNYFKMNTQAIFGMVGDKSWTPSSKVELLNKMSILMDGKPCVSMIKKTARKNYGKKI